jgi:hypothetical protein
MKTFSESLKLPWVLLSFAFNLSNFNLNSFTHSSKISAKQNSASSLPASHFHPREYQQMFTADALVVLFCLYYSAFTSTQSTKQFSFSSFTFQTLLLEENQKIFVVSQVEALLLVFCLSGGSVLVLVEFCQSSLGNKSVKKRSILKLCPNEIEETVRQKKKLNTKKKRVCTLRGHRSL